jgi:hypothetical protein
MDFRGRWKGFWEQIVWGRQPMHDLLLSFNDGAIHGSGRDIIGPFTFQGVFDAATGAVVMTKKYVGRHTVQYHGQYDGEGSIFGRWSIGAEWSGPFALALEREAPSGDEPIRQI